MERLERLEKLLDVGRENRFILAWGRLLAYLAQQRWALLGSLACNVLFALGLTILALRYSQRDVIVFLKDPMGHVVQADYAALIKAGEPRDEAEIKAFALQWIRDAYEFTPLDVQDRVVHALRYVAPPAHTAVKTALRLAERADMVNRLLTVKLQDQPETGLVPQVTILRADPLEVLVSFSRQAKDDQSVKELPPLAVTLRLVQVPRSAANGHGLMIIDLTSTQSS
jgi:hypothetical protein